MNQNYKIRNNSHLKQKLKEYKKYNNRFPLQHSLIMIQNLLKFHKKKFRLKIFYKKTKLYKNNINKKKQKKKKNKHCNLRMMMKKKLQINIKKHKKIHKIKKLILQRNKNHYKINLSIDLMIPNLLNQWMPKKYNIYI